MPDTTTGAGLLTAEVRDARPGNRFGIAGLDHTGMPCRDPERSGRFLEQVLGAVEGYRAGFDADDIAAGKPKHIFYHVGDVLIEVVPALFDESAYKARESEEPNPHWAFRMSAEGLLAFARHLDAQQVPYSGPRSHGRTTAVSIYFVDLDGNRLEVTSYEPMPEGAAVTPIGGPHGGVPWSKLWHDWTPEI